MEWHWQEGMDRLDTLVTAHEGFLEKTIQQLSTMKAIVLNWLDGDIDIMQYDLSLPSLDFLDDVQR